MGVPTIRKATHDDIETLVGLLNQLFIDQHDFQPDAEKQKAGLKITLDDEARGHILVAMLEGKIVGMIHIIYVISSATGSKVGILEDMIIDVNCRCQGINTDIIRYALDFVEENGCKRVTLLIDRDSQQEHMFYSKHGFKKSHRQLLRKNILLE